MERWRYWLDETPFFNFTTQFHCQGCQSRTFFHGNISIAHCERPSAWLNIDLIFASHIYETGYHGYWQLSVVVQTLLVMPLSPCPSFSVHALKWCPRLRGRMASSKLLLVRHRCWRHNNIIIRLVSMIVSCQCVSWLHKCYSVYHAINIHWLLLLHMHYWPICMEWP